MWTVWFVLWFLTYEARKVFLQYCLLGNLSVFELNLCLKSYSFMISCTHSYSDFPCRWARLLTWLQLRLHVILYCSCKNAPILRVSFTRWPSSWVEAVVFLEASCCQEPEWQSKEYKRKTVKEGQSWKGIRKCFCGVALKTGRFSQCSSAKAGGSRSCSPWCRLEAQTIAIPPFPKSFLFSGIETVLGGNLLS